jgi:hypothetical protein
VKKGNPVDSEEFPDNVSDEDPAFDASVSHHARGYNYLLGGKDHFAADRAYVDAVAAVYPGVVATARANRAFLGRAVRFLAGEAGLSQFLDIGTGIPAPGSTHEVAQEVRPDSRIVYVDNDPVVLSHARAFLVGREPGATDYLDADLRDPGFILREAAKTLDFTRPVGLLLIAILHAIPDQGDPHRIVATLMDALPVGSYLTITHWVTDEADRKAEEEFVDVTREMSLQQYTARSQAEVARFFEGLDPVAPGLVPMQDWRPAPQDQAAEDLIPWVCGVGRKV